MNPRRFASVGLFVWSALAALGADASANRWLLWYDRPAQYWEEALPVGNGRIGAMVYGGVQRDQIQLNEETIWSGAPTPKLSLSATNPLPAALARQNEPCPCPAAAPSADSTRTYK